MKKYLFFICLLIFTIYYSTAKAEVREGNNISVQVMYPNGGERFSIGDKVLVKWKSINIDPSADVSIVLKNEKTGVHYGHSAFIPNNGERKITIRTDIPSGEYSLLIKSGDYSDYSDKTFLISTKDFSSYFETIGVNDIASDSAVLQGFYKSIPYGNAAYFEYSDNKNFNNSKKEMVIERTDGDFSYDGYTFKNKKDGGKEVSLKILSLAGDTKYYFKFCHELVESKILCGKVLDFKTLPVSIVILPQYGPLQLFAGESTTLDIQTKGILASDKNIKLFIRDNSTLKEVYIASLQPQENHSYSKSQAVKIPENLQAGSYSFVIYYKDTKQAESEAFSVVKEKVQDGQKIKSEFGSVSKKGFLQRLKDFVRRIF